MKALRGEPQIGAHITVSGQAMGLIAGTLLWGVLLLPVVAQAGPWLTVGDILLRHDLQLLADEGLIEAPLSSWPLSAGDIARAIAPVDDLAALPEDQRRALRRVRRRTRDAARTGELDLHARVSIAADPGAKLRTFEAAPRAAEEAQAGAQWMGERFALRLRATGASEPEDGRKLRLDGSYAGVALGNWMLSYDTLERWWGPGWEGSLILSNNARPFPAITLARNHSTPFTSRWLRWLGPWRFTMMMGDLEGARAVPDPLFFGMRFVFKPLRGLELGLSRSAQWCGEGRPCDLSTFRKLLFGNDNRGVNLSRAQEPGNQLAGYDFRWASPLIDLPFAVYGQTIGEDEAGGLPSKFLGQFGVETWGGWKGTSYRIHLEYSDTACGFASSTPQLNCAYNHGIYRSGYRYRGRSIGFATDNDARMVAAGFTLIDAWSHPWNLLLRRVRLNRDGGGQNNLTLAAQTINNLELSNSLKLGGARFTWGVGVDRRRDESGNGLSYDERGFFQWEQRLQ